MSKWDKRLIAIAIGISLLILGIRFLGGNKKGSYAAIYFNGQKKEIINLNKEIIKRFSFEENNFITIEVKSGKLRVYDSSCPNKICVNTGWISRALACVVCVPNKIVVRIEGENKEVDVMTY